MKDAFKANYSLTKPVIIIDDLITTGSSLRASLAALRQQKINVKACVVMVSHH
jgi:orotate phosphoribosyltransferase